MQDTMKLGEHQAGVEANNPLETLLREGARQMLEKANSHEVDEYIAQHADEVDERKH